MADYHPEISHSQYHAADIGSERSFGIVFCIFFLVVGVYPLFSGGSPRIWAFFMSAVLLAAAYVAPRLLRYPNLLWFKFGLLLAAIISPIAISIVYFLAVVPIGLLMRAAGKDPLALRLDRTAATYWVDRKPPGPAPESLRNQF